MTIEMALQSAGIERLDAEVLLAHAMGTNRSWLFAHAPEELTPQHEEKFVTLCERRRSQEPVAYITGMKEFHGREFLVTPDVLIPRPATEELVRLVIDTFRNPHDDVRDADTDIIVGCKLLGSLNEVQTIVDVGTGSGCIAATLACEFPNMHVIGTDQSSAALSVAQKNVDLHHVNLQVELRQGNLLEALPSMAGDFFVVANLPYIPKHDELESTVKDFEPHQALFGGMDGAMFVRELWKQAHAHPHCRGIALECRRSQWQHLLK